MIAVLIELARQHILCDQLKLSKGYWQIPLIQPGQVTVMVCNTIDRLYQYQLMNIRMSVTFQ